MDTQYTSGGIHVINKAGTTLPSTGGIGTTIFYLIGGRADGCSGRAAHREERMENK